MHVALAVVLFLATVAADAGVGDAGAERAPVASAPDGGAAGPDAAAPGPEPPAPAAEAARAVPGAPPASEAAAAVPEASPATPPLLAVTVHILARGSRDGIAGAVVLEHAQTLAEADPRGDASLRLSAGHHDLQISADGFILTTFPYDVDGRGDAPRVVTVRMERNPAGRRYESVVRAPPAGPARVTLSHDEATKTPGALGDPFRVIESLPGVAPLALGVPVFTVRGSNPGNTGFFLDDLRIPALFHFALGPAVIQPGFIDKLDFYPGSYPARYGRFVGGAVVSSTQEAPRDRVRGSVDVRLYDASALLSSPVDGGSGGVMVGGRYSYTGGLLSLLSPDVTLDYWDYQLRADDQVGPGRMTLLAFGSHDRLALAHEPDQNVAIGFHRASLRYVAPFAGGRVGGSFGLGYDESLLPFEDHQHLALRSHSLLPRLFYMRQHGAKFNWEVGLDGEWESVRAQLDMPSLNVASFAQSRALRSSSAYVTATWQPDSRFSVSPTFRVDDYREGSAHVLDVSPRLDARLRLGEGLWLKANGGRFTQLPALPLALPGIEGLALGRLGLQTSWQGSVGLEGALPATLSVDTNLFLQRAALSDIRDTENGSSVLLDDFLTKRQALAYGAEVMVRRPATERLYGWLSYTLSWSLRAYEGGVVAPGDWDQRHVLNLVVGWRIGANTLGARFHARSGRLVEVADRNPPERRRLPAFYELDLRAEHRYTFDVFVLDLYAEVVNTTLTREVVGLRDESGTFVREGYRLFLPSLGVRATF